MVAKNKKDSDLVSFQLSEYILNTTFRPFNLEKDNVPSDNKYLVKLISIEKFPSEKMKIDTSPKTFLMLGKNSSGKWGWKNPDKETKTYICDSLLTARQLNEDAYWLEEDWVIVEVERKTKKIRKDK